MRDCTKLQLRAPEAETLHRDPAPLHGAAQKGPELTATRHTSTAAGPQGPAASQPRRR